MSHKSISLIFFISLFLLNACCEMGEDGCMVDLEDCNEDLQMFSEFQERLSIFEINAFRSTANGAEPLPSNTNVDFETSFFELGLIYQTFAFDQPNGQGDFIEINEPQYCIPESLGIIESIENIEITTLFDFNDQIKAGASINQFFNLSEQLSLAEYLNLDITERKLNFNYTYHLTEKPTANENFAFEMTLSLDSGATFTAQSAVINFE